MESKEDRDSIFYPQLREFLPARSQEAAEVAGRGDGAGRGGGRAGGRGGGEAAGGGGGRRQRDEGRVQGTLRHRQGADVQQLVSMSIIPLNPYSFSVEIDLC